MAPVANAHRVSASTACWWKTRPNDSRRLEGIGLREDRTIRLLEPQELVANRDLRAKLEEWGLAADDLLAYGALADGPFGRFRLAALFPRPAGYNPPVHCLDGPRGAAASEHRYNDTELCLFYVGDPPERRWKSEDGLRRLFDLARRHLTGE